MIVLMIEDRLDTRSQEQRNGGHVAPPRGKLSPVVSVVYQDSTGIHTGKYQITVYRDPSSGNNRYTNKAHQGPTRGIYIKITAIEQAYVFTSSSVLLLTLVTKDWQTATHPR